MISNLIGLQSVEEERTDRKDDLLTAEAAIAVMLPQSKNIRATQSQKKPARTLLETFEGAWSF